MIHILSEYHAKRKDEKSEHAKDAPHGTDEENHHRQNCQHGQNTTPKGTHETHRHIDHETDQRPLHPIFNAGWSGAEASFPILPYFNSLFHNIDFFLCLVGGFTLLVSGGRYGRGENMQGFW